MKRAFTLVEFGVIISIILILSTMIFSGTKSARDNDALKADYLELYENIEALKLRANLGKLVNPAAIPTIQTSLQKITFTTGETSYGINGTAKNFRNKTQFNYVRAGTAATNYTGSFTLGFFPERYSGPTPPNLLAGVAAASNHYVACTDCGNFNNDVGSRLDNVRIYLTKDGTHGYYIQLSGTNYLINTISKGGYY